MITLFKTEKWGNYSMDVHSRKHCDELIMRPTDEYMGKYDYTFKEDSVKGVIKQIPGIYNIEVFNPYFLRLSYGRLFTFEEIKEKVENVFWYVNFGEVSYFNSERERQELIKKIIYGRNYRTDISRDKERCMGCCLYNNER